MNNSLKAITIFITTAVLLACGSEYTEPSQSKITTSQNNLITGISTDTQSTGFGQPASEQEIKVAAQKLGSYFNGQNANATSAQTETETTQSGDLGSTKALSIASPAKQIFRFYNHNTKAHFYTMSESERDWILQNFPFFSYEGSKFYAYSDTAATLKPVYRFYNKITATHFYTVDEAEKTTVMSNWVPAIFNYEGIAWYASTTGGADWEAVYRFFNHQTGTHFYTASASEKDHIIATWNWFRYEGVAYYVPKEASLVRVTGIAPTAATIGQATTFTVVGTNLPLTAILAVQDAVCQAPTGNTATGFSQICTPGGAIGAKTITVKTAPAANGGTVIDASRSVSASNTPVPFVSSVTPSAATIGQATTFTVVGTNLPTTATLTIVDATCSAATGNTTTGFSQICTLGGTAGVKAITIKTASNGTVIDATRSVTVAAAPSPTVGLLPDTGITSSQCYGAGSNALISCSSTTARTLNDKQDGMFGQDASNANAIDGKLGFSYSEVPNAAGGNYARTDCVKDNITGLMWEGKPTSGNRANGLLFNDTPIGGTAQA